MNMQTFLLSQKSYFAAAPIIINFIRMSNTVAVATPPLVSNTPGESLDELLARVESVMSSGDTVVIEDLRRRVELASWTPLLQKHFGPMLDFVRDKAIHQSLMHVAYVYNLVQRNRADVNCVLEQLQYSTNILSGSLVGLLSSATFPHEVQVAQEDFKRQVLCGHFNSTEGGHETQSIVAVLTPDGYDRFVNFLGIGNRKSAQFSHVILDRTDTAVTIRIDNSNIWKAGFAERVNVVESGPVTHFDFFPPLRHARAGSGAVPDRQKSSNFPTLPVKDVVSLFALSPEYNGIPNLRSVTAQKFALYKPQFEFFHNIAYLPDGSKNPFFVLVSQEARDED